VRHQTQFFFSDCLLLVGTLRIFVVLCVFYVFTGHFVMVSLNLTCLHIVYNILFWTSLQFIISNLLYLLHHKFIYENGLRAMYICFCNPQRIVWWRLSLKAFCIWSLLIYIPIYPCNNSFDVGHGLAAAENWFKPPLFFIDRTKALIQHLWRSHIGYLLNVGVR